MTNAPSLFPEANKRQTHFRGKDLAGLLIRETADLCPGMKEARFFVQEGFSWSRTKKGARRAWRFDVAWPKAKVALEIDGGAFRQGRHTRGAGFKEDMDKGNAAILSGWRVLHCLPDQVRSLRILPTLRAALSLYAPKEG